MSRTHNKSAETESKSISKLQKAEKILRETTDRALMATWFTGAAVLQYKLFKERATLNAKDNVLNKLEKDLPRQGFRR